MIAGEIVSEYRTREECYAFMEGFDPAWIFERRFEWVRPLVMCG